MGSKLKCEESDILKRERADGTENSLKIAQNCVRKSLGGRSVLSDRL